MQQQGCDNGVAAHRRTVVRVQHEAARVDATVAASLNHQIGCDVSGFTAWRRTLRP